MDKSLIIKKEITFQARQEKVWKLLTHPEMTKQYMFGCEVLSDWQVGSRVDWKGKTAEGEDIVYVTGEVTEIVPGQKVSLTMIDPNMGLEDIPENYAHLTYELSSPSTGTLLALTQSYSTEGTDAQKRYEESLKGWDHVISLMKKVLGEME